MFPCQLLHGYRHFLSNCMAASLSVCTVKADRSCRAQLSMEHGYQVFFLITVCFMWAGGQPSGTVCLCRCVCVCARTAWPMRRAGLILRNTCSILWTDIRLTTGGASSIKQSACRQIVNLNKNSPRQEVQIFNVHVQNFSWGKNHQIRCFHPRLLTCFIDAKAVWRLSNTGLHVATEDSNTSCRTRDDLRYLRCLEHSVFY